jgi:hypothetical protein
VVAKTLLNTTIYSFSSTEGNFDPVHAAAATITTKAITAAAAKSYPVSSTVSSQTLLD